MTMRLATARPIPGQFVRACSAVASEWIASMAMQGASRKNMTATAFADGVQRSATGPGCR
jgi:hypothetical protein